MCERPPRASPRSIRIESIAPRKFPHVMMSLLRFRVCEASRSAGDAGEKRRGAAQHHGYEATEESAQTELTGDEAGMAEHVTSSDDSADRHRTPRPSRLERSGCHRQRAVHDPCAMDRAEVRKSARRIHDERRGQTAARD